MLSLPVAMVSSVVLPMLLSATHSLHVIGLWGHEVARMPAAHSMMVAGARATLRGWLDCSADLGRVLLRVWLAGTALVLTWAAVNAWRVRRLVRSPEGLGVPVSEVVVDGIPALETDGSRASIGRADSSALAAR